MTKKRRRLRYSLLFLLVVCVAWRLSEPIRPVRTKVPNAESRVVITFRSDYSGIEQQTLEIYDQADKAFLFELFGKWYRAGLDTPSCPFGSCFISFVHKRNIISFFPAMDGCGLVRYRRKYFFITQDETVKLLDICHKYEKTQ